MKLRKISEITATLPFAEFDFMQKYRESFAVSELGRIYAQLPLKEMAEKICSHGPKPNDEDAGISAARRIIGTLRSTVMDGSFGNQKQHYGIVRIEARNSRSETLLLFFGIQCANAAILAARQFAIVEKEN